MTMTVMRASAAQRSRVTLEEGVRLKAYKDTVGVWTIGKGHAATNPIPVRGLLNGEFYQGPPKEGVTITPSEVERLFDLDMDETERGISALVTSDLSQSQFDALTDFVHQYGLDRFRESTLLVKINFNPNSPAVLEQFMRWTRAGGEHQEYVWRRSARRCCIYNGTPIPQALWRKNGFPFAVTADDKVDYSITPTIDKIIAYGKKAAEPFKFDPAKISLEPQAPPPTLKDALDGIPTLPVPGAIEDEDELFLDTPAAPETDAKGAAPSPATQPEVARAPQPDSNPAASPAGSRPVPASEAPQSPAGAGASPLPPLPKPSNVPAPRPFDPPVIAGQGGVKPMHPETKMPDMIPYRIDPHAGAKPLESTERFLGSVFILLGTLTRTAMANGFKLSGAGGVIVAWILTLMKDPVHFAIFVAFCAMAITGTLWLFGVCLQKFGVKKKRKGEAGSSQLMY